jgi:hypothetical protein
MKSGLRIQFFSPQRRKEGAKEKLGKAKSAEETVEKL